MQLDGTLRAHWVHGTGDTWRAELPAGFMQGRSVYGGLTTALAVALAHRFIADRPLRNVAVQFLRPSEPGAVDGRCEVLREGRYTTFARVTLSRGGADFLVVSLVFALARDATEVPARTVVLEGSPADVPAIPYIEGMTPQFLQNFDVRWTIGGFPYTGAEEAVIGGWIRARAAPCGEPEGVLAMLDAWPCPSLSMVQGVVMASSVSWSAHLVRPVAPTPDWFHFRYETIVGIDGMHTATGELRTANGELVAWTEQLMAVFG